MPLDHIDLVAFAREEQRGLYVMTGEAMGNGAMVSGAMVSGWGHDAWSHGSGVSMTKVRRACTSITSHMKVRVRG